MDSIILNSPLLLALILASAGFCLWDRNRRSGYILQLLSAMFGGGGILCAFFAGASLQELAIVALLMFVLQMQVFVRRDEK